MSTSAIAHPTHPAPGAANAAMPSVTGSAPTAATTASSVVGATATAATATTTTSTSRKRSRTDVFSDPAARMLYFAAMSGTEGAIRDELKNLTPKEIGDVLRGILESKDPDDNSSRACQEVMRVFVPVVGVLKTLVNDPRHFIGIFDTEDSNVRMQWLATAVETRAWAAFHTMCDGSNEPWCAFVEKLVASRSPASMQLVHEVMMQCPKPDNLTGMARAFYVYAAQCGAVRASAPISAPSVISTK